MHYFLGLEVWQRSDEVFLSQGKYIVEILQRFGMMDCKSMTTPMTINLKLESQIFRFGGSHDVQTVDWILDVPD
jgi:hypothetical protein